MTCDTSHVWDIVISRLWECNLHLIIAIVESVPLYCMYHRRWKCAYSAATECLLTSPFRDGIIWFRQSHTTPLWPHSHLIIFHHVQASDTFRAAFKRHSLAYIYASNRMQMRHIYPLWLENKCEKQLIRIVVRSQDVFASSCSRK